jgi:Flp pilus assembly protein TadG
MRSFRSRARSGAATERRGAATVETALVLPVFFMVMLGIVEIGRAFMVSQLLTNAAREGARTAIMTNSTNTEVENVVKDILQRTVGVAPSNVAVTIDVVEYPGNPATGDDVSLAKQRDLVEVEIRVNYDKVNMLPIKYLTGAQLLGQAAMRHE